MIGMGPVFQNDLIGPVYTVDGQGRPLFIFRVDGFLDYYYHGGNVLVLTVIQGRDPTGPVFFKTLGRLVAKEDRGVIFCVPGPGHRFKGYIKVTMIGPGWSWFLGFVMCEIIEGDDPNAPCEAQTLGGELLVIGDQKAEVADKY